MEDGRPVESGLEEPGRLRDGVRRGLGVYLFLALALCLAAGLVATAFRPTGRLAFWPIGRLVKDLELQSERRLSHGNFTILRPGERFRLDLRLRRPAAVLVFLEDPEETLSEVWPPPGGAPLLPGDGHLLPPGEGFWESADLDFGIHSLLVLTASRALSAAERTSVTRRLQEARAEERLEIIEKVRRELEVDVLEGFRQRFMVGLGDQDEAPPALEER
jgi:hypothetical protein